MKIIFLILLTSSLVGCSKPNAWVKLTTSQDGGTTVYFNPSTGSRDGNVVRVMELSDYLTPRGGQRGVPRLSLEVQAEYDCDRFTFRYLSLYAHSGNMGTGEVVATDAIPSAWQALPKDSFGYRTAKEICSEL